MLAACSSGDPDSSSRAETSEHDMHGSNGDEENRPVIAGAPARLVTADAYTFAPKRLVMTTGEGVNITLTSIDLQHDLFVKGIGHIAHAGKGKTTRAGLTIEQPGDYEFWCTVRGHKSSGMTGTISVT
jgi:plastocyanin